MSKNNVKYWKGKKRPSPSEETRKKLSIAGKGRTHSEETRKKLSVAKIGSKNPNFGKKLSEKTRKRMSVAQKGGNAGSFKKGEHRSRKTEFGKGQIPHNKGKKATPAERKKLQARSRKFYADGGEPWNKGKTGVYPEEVLEKIRKARLKQVFPKTDSLPERILQKGLRKKGIEFEKHKPIVGQPDIFIEQNICIFADGDYWHGNPTVFNPNDEITSSGGRKKVREIWAKDEKINQSLELQGYNVLRFWEHEIKENPEKCLQKIIKIIKESRKQTSTKNS